MGGCASSPKVDEDRNFLPSFRDKKPLNESNLRGSRRAKNDGTDLLITTKAAVVETGVSADQVGHEMQMASDQLNDAEIKSASEASSRNKLSDLLLRKEEEATFPNQKKTGRWVQESSIIGLMPHAVKKTPDVKDKKKLKKHDRRNSDIGSGGRSPSNAEVGNVVRTFSGSVFKLMGDAFMDAGKRKPDVNNLGIIAFEIANIMVRIITLKAALTEEDIKELKDEVLASEGVMALVSDDEDILWEIAAEDKRVELRAIAREVIRLSQKCLSGEFEELSSYFKELSPESDLDVLSSEEMEQKFKEMGQMAQETANLYHALNKLKAMEENYGKRQREEESVLMKKSKGHDILHVMKEEMSNQEVIVKELKVKGLWNKTLLEVLGPMADSVVFLHSQMIKLFGQDVWGGRRLMDDSAQSEEGKSKLGETGLAMVYANIVNTVDGLVLRPFTSDRMRDSLYKLLPPSMKIKLKKALMASKFMHQITTDTLQETMEDTLDWLVVMAGNTQRYASERRLQGHTDLALLQTLHHCQHLPTENLIVDLLVSLNHFVARNRKEGDPAWDPVPVSRTKATSQDSGTLLSALLDSPHGAEAEGSRQIPPAEVAPEKPKAEEAKAARKTRFAELPAEEQEKLDRLETSRRMRNPGVSKSLQFFEGQRGGLSAAMKASKSSQSVSRASSSELKKAMLELAQSEGNGSTSPATLMRLKSRSLSRSSTFTTLLQSQIQGQNGEEQLAEPVFRAMTPEKLDVDQIGEEEKPLVPLADM